MFGGFGFVLFVVGFVKWTHFTGDFNTALKSDLQGQLQNSADDGAQKPCPDRDRISPQKKRLKAESWNLS